MKAQVAAFAQDLGTPGRDPVFGAGLFRLSVSDDVTLIPAWKRKLSEAVLIPPDQIHTESRRPI
jgi:hypothetical protein